MKFDYLIKGAGAMGMAFADIIFNESDLKFAIVDDRPSPGGHWNDSYPFVRLHQPSSFYGVNSTKLGQDKIDLSGKNAGLYELATKQEICSYYEEIMQKDFLPSGRVQYFPNCIFTDGGNIQSKENGKEISLKSTKFVDSTFMNVQIPFKNKPSFPIEDSVTCEPVNSLVDLVNEESQFVIIGGGKTGMDAIIWLLENNKEANDIHWIIPRDSWILNREFIQPGKFLEKSQIKFAEQMIAIAESTDKNDAFERLEDIKFLFRINPNIEPTMYRCATITEIELKLLQKIENVVRDGHVKEIKKNGIEMESGLHKFPQNTIYIDCTSDGLAKREVQPIFNGEMITLQTVRFCQQVFSAAFIAHVELMNKSEEEKNSICTVVPHPDSADDFFRVNLAAAINSFNWSQDEDITSWLNSSRLDGLSKLSGKNEIETVDESFNELLVSKLISYSS
tara:strand:- start:259 stop:1605 length:1347 start_codon:yes stop_codon:yes gene_type:complete